MTTTTTDVDALDIVRRLVDELLDAEWDDGSGVRSTPHREHARSGKSPRCAICHASGVLGLGAVASFVAGATIRMTEQHVLATVVRPAVEAQSAIIADLRSQLAELEATVAAVDALDPRPAAHGHRHDLADVVGHGHGASIGDAILDEVVDDDPPGPVEVARGRYVWPAHLTVAPDANDGAVVVPRIDVHPGLDVVRADYDASTRTMRLALRRTVDGAEYDAEVDEDGRLTSWARTTDPLADDVDTPDLTRPLRRWDHMCAATGPALDADGAPACTRRAGHTGRHAAGYARHGIRAVWA